MKAIDFIWGSLNQRHGGVLKNLFLKALLGVGSGLALTKARTVGGERPCLALEIF